MQALGQLGGRGRGEAGSPLEGGRARTIVRVAKYKQNGQEQLSRHPPRRLTFPSFSFQGQIKSGAVRIDAKESSLRQIICQLSSLTFEFERFFRFTDLRQMIRQIIQ